MSQTKIPKTTMSLDSPQNSLQTPPIPHNSHHQIPLEHIIQGYKKVWHYHYQFSGNCMKKHAYRQSDDCEQIEKRDEYIGYGTNTPQKDIINVFPFINKSFRIHKYSQPNFVKFYFTGYEELRDLGVKKIAKVIGCNYREVEGLVLDFRSCREIRDKGIESICSQIICNFSHLKHLRLNFYGDAEISEKAFMMLAKDIANYLPNLTHLFLNFLLCRKIKDKGLEFFAHHISRKLTNLTHFKFDFAFCLGLTERGIIALYKNFGKRLTNLEFFEIHLRNVFVTNQTFKALEENVIERLKGLKHLSLRFGHLPYVSNHASTLKSLFLKIGQNLPALTSLSISIWSCDHITDETVRNLLTVIQEKSQNLTTVKIHFPECLQVKGTKKFDDHQAISEYLKSEPIQTETKTNKKVGGLFS